MQSVSPTPTSRPSLPKRNRRWGLELDDFDALYEWSVDSSECFWQSVWAFGGVIGEPGATVLENADRMPGRAGFLRPG